MGEGLARCTGRTLDRSGRIFEADSERPQTRPGDSRDTIERAPENSGLAAQARKRWQRLNEPCWARWTGLAGMGWRSRASRPGWHDVRILYRTQIVHSLERALSEVVRFISKSDLERARLIREARAVYESIFPPVTPVSEQRDPKR